MDPSLLSANGWDYGWSEGLPERDISSLCVMGGGLEAAGNSSAAVAAAAAAAATPPLPKLENEKLMFSII